jgi:hypothetical protein
MATIDVLDAALNVVALEKPLTPGRAAAVASRPVALSTEDLAALSPLGRAAAAASRPVALSTEDLAALSLPINVPANFVSGVTAAMTGTTSTSLLAAPGSSLRNYITGIWVSNSHATVGTDIELQDGNAGTTFAVLPAAAAYGGAAATLPIPLRQPTANTALFVKNTTTGASTRVTAVGYKAP